MSDVPTVNIRNLRALIVTRPEPVIELRKISAYLMVRPAPVAYLKQPGQIALLSAINKQYVKTLTTNEVSFNDPVGISDPTFNCKVTMVAKDASNFSGDMTFRYNRFRLDEMIGSDTIDNPAGTQTTIHGRLTAINAANNCNLEARDVVNGTVASNTTGFMLTIASTSHLFTPGSQVTVGSPPAGNNLSTIAVDTLSGFTKVT